MISMATKATSRSEAMPTSAMPDAAKSVSA